jgi:cysteine-rich repeat protein
MKSNLNDQIKKILNQPRFIKHSSWVTLWIYLFTMMFSFVTNSISGLPESTHAETILPNDLSITKTLSGTVYPGATVETIINYHNSGPTELSGISITDSYSQYLSFDSVVSSNPDISVSPITFSHDIALKRLTWDNITLGTGANGQIILRYIVSNSLPENTDVFNAGSVGISCVSCQDPYTVANTWFSVGYVNPRPLTPPTPYDLGLAASIPQTTYTSGDFIDITLDISNDTYSSGNVMLEMVYKTFLMEFVGIVNSGVINFPTANATHANTWSNYPRDLYNNGDTSKVRRYGFAVPSGTNQVILRFKMINDYTIPINVDFNLGIPNEYNLISTVGETNSSNNTASVTVQWPEFDLWTTTTILTGDEVSPGIYSTSGTITFRIEFGNNGPARDNIILYNSYSRNTGFITYTGDRDYGPYITGYSSTLYNNIGSAYRNNISLGTNETGYIDITYHVSDDCGGESNRSNISIIDNYRTVLWVNPRHMMYNYYITNRSRETDASNNTSNTTTVWNGISCPPPIPTWQDDIAETITSDTTGDVVPGQIITVTIPWRFESSYLYNNSTLKLLVNYNTGLIFSGIVTDIPLNSSGYTIQQSLTQSERDINKAFISLWRNTNDFTSLWWNITDEPSRLEALSWLIYNNLGFGTGDGIENCSFPSFPTGNPSIDNYDFALYQRLSESSGYLSTQYINHLNQYEASGYNKIRASLFALIDTQTDAYSYSYTSNMDNMTQDLSNLIYECYYNIWYTQALQNGMTTWQAVTYAEQVRDMYAAYFWVASKWQAVNILWNHDDGLNFMMNNSLNSMNLAIEGQYYVTGTNRDERTSTTIEDTLHDAYAISLSVSGFQQLLGQRLSPYFDESKPLVWSYYDNYYNNGYNPSINYCPDILCTEQDGSGSVWMAISLGEYEDLVDEYRVYTGTSKRRAWSGGYVDRGEQFWENYIDRISQQQQLFIDNFTTTGWVAINNITSYANILNTIQLQFVVWEAPIGASLWFDARIAYGYDNISHNSCNYSHDWYEEWCFYNNYTYSDYNSQGATWGNEWDIIQGEDNTTGIVLTMGYREPYDLSITKMISQTGNIMPNQTISVTTDICNNATGRNDISLNETFLPNLIFSGVSSSTLGVPYSVDTINRKIIWNSITLAQDECKSVTTIYIVQPFVTSGSQLIFSSIGGSQWSIIYSTNPVSVSGSVIAPSPIIYTPYGNKEIVSSTFFPGDEIIYRINYNNPGSLTGIMNLYDMYESGLIFSGLISSTQWLTTMFHDNTTRMIMWTGVVVPPYSSYSIELSFVISTGKNAFEEIKNNFAYDMLFIPDTYIADADKSNNNSNWRASYSLNTFQWVVLDDANSDSVPTGDSPLAGVTVSISQWWILIWTTTTSSSGSYLFTGLLPGNYVISFTAPGGYITIQSFTGSIGNGLLGLTGTSITSQFNGYSSSSNTNITLMRASAAPFCGNTITEAWETCDDGANNGLAGYCNATCTGTVAVSLCGNGTINAGEACDDGNNTNGDACGATCQFELPSCSLNVQSYQSLNPLGVTVNLTGFGFGTMQVLSWLSYGDSTSESNLSMTQFSHNYSSIGAYTITATVANRLNTAITQNCTITVQWSNGGGWGGYAGWNTCGNNIKEWSEQCDGGPLCTSSCTILLPPVHTVAPEPELPIIEEPVPEEIAPKPIITELPETGV